MQLKDFSLLKEEPDHYVVGHPAGKSIKVPKEGLSPQAKEMVSRLKRHQAFPDGGNVQAQNPVEYEPVEEDDEDANAPQAETQIHQTQAATEQAPPENSTYTQAPPVAQATGYDTGQGQPTVTSAQAEGVAKNPQSPQGPKGSAMVPNLQTPIGESVTALQGAEKEEQQQAKNIAAGYKEAATAIENRPTSAKIIEDNQKKDQSFAEAYQKLPEIDQNRYWSNLSPLSKISAGIGIALSGIGSGISGGPNLALQTINNAINTDIESQKNNQTKALNLWKMNREQTQNDLAANLQTQNQFLTIAEMKAKQGAAAMQNPAAIERITPVILGLQSQRAQNNWLMGMIQGGPSGTEQQYQGDLKALQMTHPEIYKDKIQKYIPSVGEAATPLTEKDRDALRTYDVLDHAVNRAIAFSNKVGTTGYGTPNNAEAEAIRQDLVTGFQQLHGLNRLSDVDLALNLKNISSPGAFLQQAAQRQFEQFKHEIANKRQVEYNQLGIVPFQKSPEDLVAIAHAKQNPSLPSSQFILNRFHISQPPIEMNKVVNSGGQ